MSQSRLSITTPPVANLLNLADVKAYLRIDADSTHEDTLLNNLMLVATEQVLERTGRALLTTVFSLQIDSFRDVEIPKPPLISIDSVTYYDSAGSQQTLSSSKYELHQGEEPAVLEFLEDLPDLETNRTLPITINFTAGYGASADDVPESIKTYSKMIVGDLFDGARALSSQYQAHQTHVARMIINPYIVQPL